MTLFKSFTETVVLKYKFLYLHYKIEVKSFLLSLSFVAAYSVQTYMIISNQWCTTQLLHGNVPNAISAPNSWHGVESGVGMTCPSFMEA